MRLLFIAGLLTFSLSVKSQSTSFGSLRLPNAAGISATGGYLVATTSHTMGAYLENPALFSDSLVGLVTLSYMPHFGNTGFFMGSTVVKVPKIGPFHISFRHFGYGTMDGYDPAGNPTGDFTAGESSLVMGKGLRAGNFAFGVNAKFNLSGISGYYAGSIALDLGGIFTHPEHDFSVGMTINNAGFVLRDFTKSSGSTLPLDIRVGTSYKPEHMPFRFLLTGYNLIPSRYTYFDYYREDMQGVKRVLRYINIGGELFLNNSIQLLAGYNFLRRHEMKLENKTGATGLALGMRLRKNGFGFEYGYAKSLVAGSEHHVTLGLNTMKKFKKIGKRRNIDEE